MSTGVDLALKICGQLMSSYCLVKDKFLGLASRLNDEIKRFASGLAELHAGFTEVAVVKLAAGLNLDPLTCEIVLRIDDVPPFTIRQGDIGYFYKPLVSERTRPVLAEDCNGGTEANVCGD